VKILGRWLRLFFVAALVGLAGPTAVAQSTSAWDTYKLRLSILARQQGVSPQTVATYVPGLSINNTAIRMEATEPSAASTSGGIVYSISPYLRRHVTPNMISRGQRNYSDHYSSLRALDQRTGVDSAVLMRALIHI
jgi:membrane-bound lytic murein transglycosylase B